MSSWSEIICETADYCSLGNHFCIFIVEQAESHMSAKLCHSLFHFMLLLIITRK